MKDDKTQLQSLSMKDVIKRYSVYPEYNLVMPAFYIKKKCLKRLTIDDIFLLGLDRLELLLTKDDKVYASVDLESTAQTVKVNIVNIEVTDKRNYDKSKYECVICSFGKLQCRKFEVGHKVEIFDFNALEVELFIENKKFSKASLVKVDDEIAIKVTEVYSE